MTEKQQAALNAVLSLLPDDCRGSYREVAEYAISLGYMPVIKGTRKDYADFTNSKINRTILKINTSPNFRWIAMKFFALPEYNGIFRDAVDVRRAYWEKLGYAARCFGCGKCDGTHGYKFYYPDGQSGFLCGYGIVPVPAFKPENVQEVKDALKTQNDFFVRHTGG